MGIEVTKRTELREVDGITFDMRPDGTLKHRMHKIIFRITKDKTGKSISLCDELRGIMIGIPLEPVEDLFKFAKGAEEND